MSHPHTEVKESAFKQMLALMICHHSQKAIRITTVLVSTFWKPNTNTTQTQTQ